MARDDINSWTELVAGLVAKFDAGVVTGNSVTFNPVGAEAMRDLLKTMAEKLDLARDLLATKEAFDKSIKEAMEP